MARKLIRKNIRRRAKKPVGKFMAKRYVATRKPRIYRSLVGFPPTRVIRMRYCENYSMSSSIGIMSTYTFRCNSIFDPNQTGIGHQPLGHDQWANFYNKYVVIGSKILIVAQGSGNSSVTSIPVYTGIKRDQDNVVSSDYLTLKEQGTSSRVFQPLGDAKMKLSMGYSAKKHWGIKDVKDNVERIGASFGSNPTNEMYFVHFLQTQDRTSSSSTTLFTATIDYIVLLFEPKDLPGS